MQDGKKQVKAAAALQSPKPCLARWWAQFFICLYYQPGTKCHTNMYRDKGLITLICIMCSHLEWTEAAA